jgi:RNA polymerase sigma-70 factor (ECF subfamily)
MGLLYDAYLPKLYRYCLGRLRNETEAEDLTEEIFVKVLRGIRGFEWRPTDSGSSIPFGAWLFRIARNELVSYQRRAARSGIPVELSDSIEDGQRGPAELTETKISIEEVFAAVRELPDAQREVILLRFASGLSVAETAEALQKQQTNVKVLQHKGIRRLRDILVDSRNTAGR